MAKIVADQMVVQSERRKMIDDASSKDRFANARKTLYPQDLAIRLPPALELGNFKHPIACIGQADIS
jgi:hypothetical protein